MTTELKDYLLRNVPGLTPEDLEILLPSISFKKYKSGDIFISPGENNTKVFYIKSGIIRVYHLLENGTEKTMLFHNKKSFVGNYGGIIFKRPSRFFYQAVGETEVFELTYDAIDKGAQKSISLNNLRGNMFLMMIGILLNNIEDFVLLKPKKDTRNTWKKMPRFCKKYHQNISLLYWESRQYLLAE